MPAADQTPPPSVDHALESGIHVDENGISGSAESPKTNGHVSFAPDVEPEAVANTEVVGGVEVSDDLHASNANGVVDTIEANGIEDQAELGVNGHGKKRKFDRITKELTRKVSPPWKKVAAEGPTSFVLDGRRKSSRTNGVPMEMQPPSNKRTTRGKQTRTVGRPPNGTRSVHAANGNPSSLARRSSSGRRSMVEHQKLSITRESTKPKRTSLPAAIARPGPKPRPPPTPVRAARTPRASFSTTDKGRPFDPPSPTSPRSSRTTRNLRALPASQASVKLRIRVGSPTFQQHPKHFVLTKPFEDLSSWLATDNPLSDELPPSLADKQLSPEEQALQRKRAAQREALARINLVRAAEPGGPLAEGTCTAFYDPPHPDPRPRWGRWDFVAAHAANFHSLMRAEAAKHKKNAALLARACAAEIYSPGPSIFGGKPGKNRWAFLQEAKSAEEVWREERGYQIRRYKQLVKDVEAKWKMAQFEVDKIREAAWEKEQEVQGNKVLDDLLGKSTMLLQQQFGDGTSTPGSDSRRGSVVTFESASGSAVESEEEGESGSEGDEDDASNMSESEDEDEEEETANDPDAGLTQAELLAKYASLPDLVPESSDEEEVDENSEAEDVSQMEIEDSVISDLLNGNSSRDHTPTPTPDPELMEEYKDLVIDDVDPILMDDDDESSGMSDEDLTDDDSMEDEDDDGESEEEDNSMSLAALFSKAELDKLRAEQEAQIKLEDSEPEREVSQSVEEMLAEDKTEEYQHDADETNATIEEIAMEDVVESPAVTEEAAVASSTPRPSHDPAESTRSTSLAINSNADTRIPISPLLRGTLREYQHDGVDWLAKLYSGNRNGILADEMGLGKTIQTIALLAHLATEHHVWGPHLIVVPTSVILNWEMEFKKFCPGFKILTYYGNIEERRAKRKGWTNNDLWNVCITSYQLIIQDAQAFKKRSWHYLVLDEAHNIKNFQSLRWQTLLTFKTHSRLLLTGTPLQNNLQELWSLLYFLMPGGTDGVGGFADLEKFLNSMKRPADQILDQGLQQLDPEAQARVDKLHEILRPFLLRRLKSQVEKQMPSKYEHVVYCRLSKRQRQLYDGFMSRADTKRTLSSGNYMSIINVLMSLRKVCNHPDLFETRQIVTSLAMQKCAVAGYEPVEALVRRMLQPPPDKAEDQIDLNYTGLIPVNNEHRQRRYLQRLNELSAAHKMENMAQRELKRLEKLVSESSDSVLTAMSIEAQKNIARELQDRAAHVRSSLQKKPIYGKDLLDLVTFPRGSNRWDPPKPAKKKNQTTTFGDWFLDRNITLQAMMPTVEDQANKLIPLVTKFGCVTPAVVAEDVLPLSLTPKGVELVQLAQEAYPLHDPYHEARIRLSIAFPDRRLLQYDCGKLQALDGLLRGLQAGGHRCLIFTQMTKVLDILEQFLNIYGHRYLRLDGATKIEQRQILTDRFNNDDRILAFILSSRSGGLGINLTGADTVIFYDLDWNPAMDKQCQDRCHRIGQTRDVHIYRFVSEHTIEANILRKSNQKRLLDDVIIQRGEFTTDVFQERVTYRDALVDLMDPSTTEGTEEGKAMDKVLGDIAGLNKVLDAVEDTEDVTAAKAAQKEVVSDDADFTEVKSAGPTTGAATTPAAEDGVNVEDEEPKEIPHVDEYLVRFLKDYELFGVPFRPPMAKVKPKKPGIDMKRRKR
jgi:helicase SWR1